MSLRTRVQRAEAKMGNPNQQPIKALMIGYAAPSDDGPTTNGPELAYIIGRNDGPVARRPDETASDFKARVDAIIEGMSG